MASRIEERLGVRELRLGFAKYTRRAYGLVPNLEKEPRILEIGCGFGASMVELGRLGLGQVVGIDIDGNALEDARQRIAAAGLDHRLRVQQTSLLDLDCEDSSFDLLWDEGALHILSPADALTQCSRLLKPGGHLVSCETLVWMERVHGELDRAGLEIRDRVVWEKGAWWNDYYAPLEQRIAVLREELTGRQQPLPEGLHRYENEIRMVKQDLPSTDCGHFLIQKSTRSQGCST